MSLPSPIPPCVCTCTCVCMYTYCMYACMYICKKTCMYISIFLPERQRMYIFADDFSIFFCVCITTAYVYVSKYVVMHAILYICTRMYPRACEKLMYMYHFYTILVLTRISNLCFHSSSSVFLTYTRTHEQSHTH